MQSFARANSALFFRHVGSVLLCELRGFAGFGVCRKKTQAGITGHAGRMSSRMTVLKNLVTCSPKQKV